MTIGVGVLGTGNEFKPDTVILVSDTRGSVGDSYSTPGLHKMWEFPEEHLYSVASGNMEKAGEFLNLVQRKFRAIQHREHGPIQIALNQAVLEYRMERGWLEILPSFLMSRNDWYYTAIDPSLRSDILDTWQRFDVGCELIIGTFTDAGQALLYYIPSIGLVDDPGNPRAG